MGVISVDSLTLISLALGLVGLVYAVLLAFNLKKKSSGTDKMEELSGYIYDGAMTFLNKQYIYLLVFAVTVAVLLAVLGWQVESFPAYIWLTYLVGAFLSALAGNIGMRVATGSNARAANAVERDIKSGLKVAFSSGAVMGMSVVGFGVVGIGTLFYFGAQPELLFGFGFGASSIALFARVGGGIYTKAADVGADLVGKVEEGIPEDDPRNPAVIADNVGDNVGDVAGMGADLFESYANSIISAMALASLVAGSGGLLAADMLPVAMVLPLLLAAIGIFSSFVGSFFVGRGSGENLHMALNLGVFTSAIIMAVLGFSTIFWLLEGNMSATLAIFGSMAAGLIAGIVIGLSTEIYTSYDYSPTKSIAEASTTGAATNIIRGLSVGMMSTWVPVIAVVAGILSAYSLAGLYGIAMAAVGMLSTLGITLAVDCYGPVADNAAGIAEMAGMGQEVREKAEALDSVGNTTAAIGKGFAIGSAALTALALFSNYQANVLDAGIKIDFAITDPTVMVGLLIGGLLPFLFSAMTMEAVGKAAQQMITEVRRQFSEVTGILEGTEEPDYQKCIDISTAAALKEMIIPGTMAVVIPVLVGIWDPSALGGLLAGAIVTGFLLAIFMANSGGAWDNAKKYIEKGHHGGKGSDAHSAAVVGDTVGDPFKDTSGPSLNILIKLMSIVSVVFVPLFIEMADFF